MLVFMEVKIGVLASFNPICTKGGLNQPPSPLDVSARASKTVRWNLHETG